MNEAVTEKILAALRNGNTRKASAECAGIHEDTFHLWIRNNSDFSDAVAQAESEAEAMHVGVIAQAAQKGDWRASESWLKRRRAKDWSEAVVVAGSKDNPVEVNAVVTVQGYVKGSLADALEAIANEHRPEIGSEG
jgi:hypothetical protein